MQVARYSDAVIQAQRTHDGIMHQSRMISILNLPPVCAVNVLQNNDQMYALFVNSCAC